MLEEGKTLEELEEERAMKEQLSHQKVLEMVGDLPDADIRYATLSFADVRVGVLVSCQYLTRQYRPPDNVLFICKLNAATREEDLHLIFSRFGPIKSCEIIKDKKVCISFIVMI